MFTTRQMAWGAWLAASLFYAYQYILRVMPNIMLTDIMQQFGINAAIFGQFSGAYYIGYCLMHLPIGIMLDRYGPRNVMSACILLTVIGLLPIIFAEHWIYPILGRLLIGMGSSAAILGTFKIIRVTFDEQYFTRMLSFSVTLGLIGAIYGGMPVSYLCETYGYKMVVEIFAVLGIIFAFIVYKLLPHTRSEHKSTIIFDLKTVFTHKKVIWICCFAGLMVGPMEGFADAWGSEFLKQVYGFNGKTANYLTSLIYIGMCFAPILSRVAERREAYLKTITGSGILMLIIFAMLVLKLLEVRSMMVGFFIVGICCAYQILAIYKASTYVTEQMVGLTTAVANMVIMSFGYLFHSLIGWIIKTYNNAGEASAFSYGMSVIPIALLIGSAGFLIMAYQEKAVFKKLQFN